MMAVPRRMGVISDKWKISVSELHIVNFQEVGRVVFGIFDIAQHENATHLGHGLDLKHAGHDGLMREVSLEIGFIGSDVLDADHMFLALLDDLVDKQHRVAVRQHLAYLVDVVERFLVRVIFGCLNILVAQFLTYLLGQLGVDGVSRTGGYDAALQGSADECQVAKHIE